MAHKLRSNQTVIFNAESQSSGVLEIVAEQVIFQNDDNFYHNVMLQMPVKVSGSGHYVTNLNYNLSAEEWSNFYSASVGELAPDTGNFDEVLETALHYARTTIDGKWGLTTNDWEFITE